MHLLVVQPSRSSRRALRRAGLVALTLLLPGLIPDLAAAGGFTLTSMGGRRAASLVNLARPDDPTALFHNPAGLADQPGLSLHLSGALVAMKTRFRLRALPPALYPEINPPGCGAAGAPPCPWPLDAQGFYAEEIVPEQSLGVVPYLGVSTDLGALGARDVVVAAAAYLPAFYGGSTAPDSPTRYHLLEGHFLVGAATLGAGWRLNRYVALGGSLSYLLMRTTFSQSLSILASTTSPGARPSMEAEAAQLVLGDLTASFGATDHGIGWGAAALITPLPWLALGINYSGSTPARFEGPLTLRPDRNPETLPTLLQTGGLKLPRRLEVEMAVPHTVQLGVSVAPLDWLELGFDLRMWLYQLIEELPVRPIYNPAEPGTPAIDAAALTRKTFYRMSYELALGVALRPFSRRPGLELMAGLSYDQSPYPDPTFTLASPSLSSVNFAVGVRWAPSRNLRITVSYAQYVYLERNIINSVTSPPTNGIGVGVAFLPGVELQYTFGAGR